jgi:hypothetical protein
MYPGPKGAGKLNHHPFNNVVPVRYPFRTRCFYGLGLVRPEENNAVHGRQFVVDFFKVVFVNIVSCLFYPT